MNKELIDKNNFDPFAKQYNELLKASLGNVGGSREEYGKYKVEEVCKRQRGKLKIRLLDFGCGDGTSLFYFRKIMEDWRLTGIDISQESIHKAKQLGIDDCDVQVFQGIEIPFEDGSFDIVFIANVMHHIPFEYHNQVSTEVFRVLKKGGTLYIFEHNPLNPVTKKIFADCIFDNDATMLPASYSRELLQQNGFQDIRFTYHLFFPRNRFFRWLLSLEAYLKWLPIGGQYCVEAKKRTS
jgi:SAM-dependent methyltransferase